MTELRHRMIEDMRLHSLSEATQRAYVDAVANLARYFKRSPDQVTEEELRRFFVSLTRRRARSTVRVHLFALRFLYRYSLRRLQENPRFAFYVARGLLSFRRSREPRGG